MIRYQKSKIADIYLCLIDWIIYCVWCDHSRLTTRIVDWTRLLTKNWYVSTLAIWVKPPMRESFLGNGGRGKIQFLGWYLVSVMYIGSFWSGSDKEEANISWLNLWGCGFSAVWFPFVLYSVYDLSSDSGIM